MEPKYAKGQKVKIVSVKDQHLHTKYPEIQGYVNETGTILDSYFIPMRGVKGITLAGEVSDLSLYKIRLDKDDIILEAVTEDSLAALDE
jgi:hypothetical protein